MRSNVYCSSNKMFDNKSWLALYTFTHLPSGLSSSIAETFQSPLPLNCMSAFFFYYLISSEMNHLTLKLRCRRTRCVLQKKGARPCRHTKSVPYHFHKPVCFMLLRHGIIFMSNFSLLARFKPL